MVADLSTDQVKVGDRMKVVIIAVALQYSFHVVNSVSIGLSMYERKPEERKIGH